MSESFYFTPSDKGKNIPISDPSIFIKALENAGFSLPCEITEADLDTIRGMAAVGGEDFQTLQGIVEKFGSIQLMAEY